MSYNTSIPKNLETDINFKIMNEFLKKKFNRIFYIINKNNNNKIKLIKYKLEDNNCYHTLSFNVSEAGNHTIDDLKLHMILNNNKDYTINKLGKKYFVIIH
jgi:predicted transport protein